MIQLQRYGPALPLDKAANGTDGLQYPFLEKPPLEVIGADSTALSQEAGKRPGFRPVVSLPTEVSPPQPMSRIKLEVRDPTLHSTVVASGDLNLQASQHFGHGCRGSNGG